MDASTQEALLKDPRVQQSIKKAGEVGLNDAAVQEAIMGACKEKFPQHAGVVAGQVKKWAKDPAVQAKAKKYAGIALHQALHHAGHAGEHIIKRIEQGPTGVRVLAFIGGVASCINALLALLNILSAFTHIVLYTVSAYQLVFSLTTMLFEAKPEWIQSTQEKCPALAVDSYQDMLLENAKFLSLTGGRGLFYIFQGTMWLAFASITNWINLLVGLYLVFIGGIHVLMYHGIMPQEVAAKMREGYEAVRTKPPSATASKSEV